nr:winged helix-turn-helix domain-containing protein [Rhizobium sp. BK251]
MEPVARDKELVSFGPFTLVAKERLLLKEGEPAELGARALDILIALVRRANEVVGKKELMDEVWPDVIVEEGSLRFQVAELRRVLGDGSDARYIATLPGRGYCFVAPLTRSGGNKPASRHSEANHRHVNLPSRLARTMGRADDVSAIATQVHLARFVTILGAGGIGKTTVAVAVGHELVEAFDGDVLFVDLGMVRDGNFAANAIASTLGLSVQATDPTASVVAYLAEKRILLIIDTCEHLIEAVAALTSRIFAAAPDVHILATSREAIRIEGEHVYKLAPLPCPPDDPGLTVETARSFPAAQLFVERAIASGARLNLDDAEAAIIARICRKLDGMALAIELAAGRVAAFGLEQTAALLDQRLNLMWTGQRNAPARQQTLQATLDWSYELLSEPERAVLRRLAVFVGHFTMEAALAVATDAAIDNALVFNTIDSLVTKSMVAARPLGAMMRYRLLDTTREYALRASIDAGEFDEVAARHARYFRGWLDQVGTEWPTLLSAAERAPHVAGLANVRGALEWSFGDSGNTEIAVTLATTAAPVLLAMSLLAECHHWSERALLTLDETARGGHTEMYLQSALGVSLMFTRGGSNAARVALNRSLLLAGKCGDALDQLQVLGPLHMFHLRIGDFRTTLDYARRCALLADDLKDTAAIALAHSLSGISLHLVGELEGARAELEAALHPAPISERPAKIYLGFESRNLARGILARNLWLQGRPDQAAVVARETVEEAAGMEHPLTLCIALIWATSVFIWSGDLEAAEEHTDWLVARATAHSMAPYLAVGRAFKAELAILRGDAESGTRSLQECLVELHSAPYELMTSHFRIALVGGLASLGRLEESALQVEEAIRSIEVNGDHCYMPELLRLMGRLFLKRSGPDPERAEKCFRQSLDWSRRQGARAWELRTAIDLAALLADSGHPAAARDLLQPIYEQFTEGRATRDLKAAAALLASLA